MHFARLVLDFPCKSSFLLRIFSWWRSLMMLKVLPLVAILTSPAWGQANAPAYPQYTPGPSYSTGTTPTAPANIPMAPVVHAPDGGTRQTVISIAIPMLTGSPFTAMVETEWVKILSDGSTATTKNRRTVARDSSGRVFEERYFLTPNGDVEPRLQALQYRDPYRHEYTNCMVQQHTCYVSPMMQPARTSAPKTLRQPMNPNVKDESLGEKIEDGLTLLGTREITMLATGSIGNTRPEPIVKEFWYSPVLGVNIVTKRFDPRTGSQNFLVNHLSQSEPDPKLFEPPSGFRIVRMQSQAQSTETTP